MAALNFQALKYGTIYIYSDPERMTLLRRSAAFLCKIVHPMDIKWVDNPGMEGALFVARRFNVGNIGQYATVSLRTSEHNRGGGQMQGLHRFTDTLMGLSDPDSGDIVIDEDDYGWGGLGGLVHYNICFDDVPEPSAAPQDHTRVAKSESKRFRWHLPKKRLGRIVEAEDNNVETQEDACNSSDYYDVGASLSEEMHEETVFHMRLDRARDELQEEESRELARIEREREQALERIRRDIVNYIARYHDDPKELMASLLRGKIIVGQPGRVLVNGDLKIVLPEYDEMEIEMPAMCRTLYILFMKHRWQGGEGIVLKNIDEYRDEILDIYGLVKPGANEIRVMQSVNNLCNPYSESLNQMISRINRCIRSVITDKQLAQDYCITGERGQRYGIALDPQYLELPRAVTGA